MNKIFELYFVRSDSNSCWDSIDILKDNQTMLQLDDNIETVYREYVVYSNNGNMCYMMKTNDLPKLTREAILVTIFNILNFFCGKSFQTKWVRANGLD